MKLPLKEPLQANYLYISPDNSVHVLMPVVSGTTIGLDNTCKAVYSLQEFFGKGHHSNQKATLKNELLIYKKALESDLSLLKAQTLLSQQKQERLTQINLYLDVVTRLEKHPELNCLDQNFPTYPRSLEAIMQESATSNLYSMILRPTEEDGYLRLEAVNPVFSVAHKSIVRKRGTSISPLQQALIHAYEGLSDNTRNLKSKVIQQTLNALNDATAACDFELLKKMLQKTIETLLNIAVDFNKTKEGTPLNQKDIDQSMGFNAQTTAKEYIEALLGYCAPDLFDTIIESPFNYLTGAEAWSIATQFLLGITNIDAVVEGKISPETNFGHILDSMPDLSKHLAQTLSLAQQGNHSIEEACFSWINAHTTELKLKMLLSQDDFKRIQETFSKRYAEIKDAPHFDEFFLLIHQKKGHFFTHQGAICTHFAEFALSPLLDLPQKLRQPLEKVRSQACTLNTEIPHQNVLVQGDVEVNTTTMDHIGLQALYEWITVYKDTQLKKKCLAQLKQERPDFKPKIDKKQFLQYVAYGKQDEAEAMLQEDPELAQDLLKTEDIPFTDYSGRTFRCTAYEYAYWAKDSHMQRMLEKYIRQNEETRQFIVKKIQAIKELIPDPATSGFFGFFEKSKPRGLYYTTQDKEGRIIEHWEEHYELKPLISALNHYVNASKNKSNDKILKKIWIEEVGYAQRDVPAHIAQEYCHPNRSFEDVKKNKALLDSSNPENLKRQLKINNMMTQKNDLWFSEHSYTMNSGLGFSFGIVRTPGWNDCGEASATEVKDWIEKYCRVDVEALKVIDEVRTNDLKQSLENLSQIVPIVQLHER